MFRSRQEYQQFICDCYSTIAENMAAQPARTVNYDPLWAIWAKPQGQWTDEETAQVAAYQKSLSARQTNAPET